MVLGVQSKSFLKVRDDNVIDDNRCLFREFINSVELNVSQVIDCLELFDNDINAIFDYFSQWAKVNGINYKTMHIPGYLFEESDTETIEYIENYFVPVCLEKAYNMGIKIVIIQPRRLQYMHGKVYEYEMNMAFYRKLIPLLKKYSLLLCLENMVEHIENKYVDGVCSEVWRMQMYVNKLNALSGGELFGSCINLGNLQLANRDAYEYIMEIGEKAKVIHLCENDGKNDLQAIPFTVGCRTDEGQDWNGVFEALAAIGFDGFICYDLEKGIKNYPRSLNEQLLKVMAKTGYYIIEQIQKRKK